MSPNAQIGKITRISGPVVEIRGLNNAKLYEIVKVGDEQLIGEIIRINRTESDHISTVQVYEETTGLKPREQAFSTGNPLSAELGPGLLTKIYDGIQRPLPALEVIAGNFITRGISTTPLDEQKKWEFIPILENGAKVSGGSHIGEVKESNVVTHKIMVPPDIKLGTLSNLADRGNYTILDEIGQVKINRSTIPLTMKQLWPVRRARPVIRKLEATIPLITGQRIYDTFFPIAKGGVAAIPGGFGTGKTVSQHQLAKWSDATIVVYVGCGERGNEMAEVLKEFPSLEDPRTGEELMKRTVLIANTSNMPVAAREASVYLGITIAEYYRDMGFDVALMADSTSRWAEALREISGRLEEMPGEEGYPAYLASRIAEFYERAGRAETLSGHTASISAIGAVSPGGGDFSEPVTQNTLKTVRVFWALSYALARSRHFPAISWLESYSLYIDSLSNWYQNNVAKDFIRLREEAMTLLQKEKELQEIVQLIGPDALPDSEKIVLLSAKMIREDFLQQNAYSDDSFCPLDKQYDILKLIIQFYYKIRDNYDVGVPFEKMTSLPVLNDIAKLKWAFDDEFKKTHETCNNYIQNKMEPDILGFD
ncbi:V-type ATP synthase subunit A [Candidatus Heimdallarchaeota archaeon B3_Heim]|nr:MAG: V-type ATP synthase subunit A [Candidatus Heimdallarchaeota archaeon B3_Heim]